MSTMTIIQARSGSARLPGKIFLDIAGKPLLVRMVERVKAARLVGMVVVATTVDGEDDAVEKICEEHGISCFRGHPTDLLDRHYKCALLYHASTVLKIPSDCPLISPDIIDRVIHAFHKSGADYASNLHPATYPDGNDVEVMRFSALGKAWKLASKDFEREHTTPYIWEHPNQFSILNVEWETGQDLSMSHRYTIDYWEDYLFIKSVFEELFEQNPHFRLKEILRLLEARPDIMQLNSAYVGVNWYRHHLTELTTIDSSQTRTI